MSLSKKLSLSIIIPAYNEERHLKLCLDKIAKQTEKPDQVIVVDNNSTDKTAAIANAYSFVSLLKEPVQGIVNARNTGFNATDSDIIARIDADSHLPAGWVKRVKKYYQNPQNHNTALTGGCYIYNTQFPKFFGWLDGQIVFRVNRFVMGHYILFGSNMAIPNSIWQKVRVSTCSRNDIHEDLDLAIHTHRAGYKIDYKENLRVGIAVRRVWFNDFHKLWSYMMMWPQTLRVHKNKRWIIGLVGAVLLVMLLPVGAALEYSSRLYRRLISRSRA